MPQPALCIFTQTPYTRLVGDVARFGDAPRLDDLQEGRDHLPSPGGVTRMVRALLQAWERDHRIRQAAWVSLSATPAPRLRLSDRAEIQHATLEEAAQAEYAAAKGDLWNAIHGLAGRVDLEAIEKGLAHLTQAMSEAAARRHARSPFDLFYVHDFQLLPLAKALPPGVPVAFRWHVPVRPMDPRIEAYVARRLDEYDAVVVSTRRYADELRRMGVRAPVHVSYPYLPDASPRAVTQDDIDAFDARWGIGPEDVVFTVVGRLDPMKSQDDAIRALARIHREVPRARLLLVGGGGFSAGRGGLGMGHATEWKEQLLALARGLGVAERVTITGGILDEELEVAYARSRAVLLPSRIEGFGLAPVEAWQRGVPVVVSRGAGVSELVDERANGCAFAPGDVDALAAALRRLAADPAHARKLGERGRVTARRCSVTHGSREVWKVLAQLLPDADWARRRARW